MDDIALQSLHAALAARGYLSTVEALAHLLSAAELQTQERVLLARWESNGRTRQHASLVSVFSHARKHGMGFSFAGHSYDMLTLSHLREDRGVRLGRVELFKRETRFVFYKGNECVGERSYSF
jgi:hypothetical protein